MTQSDASDEVRIFARYLVGRTPSDRVAALYARGCALDDGGDARERKFVQFAIDRPWSLGALDAALALTQPGALLRRKLLLLAAILETQPEHCDEFLPRDRPAWYALAVAASLARAAARAAFGLLLVRVLR